MKDLFYEAEKDVNNTLIVEYQREYPVDIHFHKAFELAYVIGGSADYVIEDEHYIVEKDQIAFSHCYYKHKAFLKPKHEKYVIQVPENFSGEFSSFFQKETLPPFLHDKKFNKTLLPFIKKLAQANNDMLPFVSKGYIIIIFGLLFEHYGSVDVVKKNKNISIISGILSYLEEHYHEPLTAELVASRFGYNKCYFSHIFNEFLGITFNNYLNSLRLNKFEEQIAISPQKNVVDLAFECGFASTATFYRAKKARTDVRSMKEY